MHRILLWIITIAMGLNIYTHSNEPDNSVSIKAAASIQTANASASIQTASAFHIRETEFQAQINLWIQHIAAENSFIDWAGASWTSYPLGPGMHGWVIIVEQANKPAGYLIVNSSPDGKLLLGEYGVGDHPLFNLNTLYRSMMQQELIPGHTLFADFIKDQSIIKERIYYDAFHAAWKITIHKQSYLFDAATGEHIPVDETALQTLDSILLTNSLDLDITSAKLQATSQKPVFDPYDNLFWVTNRPMSTINFNQMEAAIRHTSVVFVMTLGDHEATFPYAVIGSQQWSNYQNFLLIYDQGNRYIPYAQFLAQTNGHFYQLNHPAK